MRESQFSLMELIQAARDGQLERVTQLLTLVRNLNSTDEYGNTALIWASGNGHAAVVAQLLARADVNTNMNTPHFWGLFKIRTSNARAIYWQEMTLS